MWLLEIIDGRMVDAEEGCGESGGYRVDFRAVELASGRLMAGWVGPVGQYYDKLGFKSSLSVAVARYEAMLGDGCVWKGVCGEGLDELKGLDGVQRKRLEGEMWQRLWAGFAYELECMSLCGLALDRVGVTRKHQVLLDMMWRVVSMCYSCRRQGSGSAVFGGEMREVRRGFRELKSRDEVFQYVADAGLLGEHSIYDRQCVPFAPFTGYPRGGHRGADAELVSGVAVGDFSVLLAGGHCMDEV